MKKSRSIRLVLLGSAGMALAACAQDELPKDSKFFSGTSECEAQFSATECADAKLASEKVHAAEAPKFARKDECEAQFGAENCETKQASNGGSIFMPMMMGYMMGSMMSGNRFSQPVYRGPGNSAVMPSGNKLLNVGSFSRGGSVGASAFQPARQVTQVSRGGFGGTAARYNSGSGG